jgi:hypothetical protein
MTLTGKAQTRRGKKEIDIRDEKKAVEDKYRKDKERKKKGKTER